MMMMSDNPEASSSTSAPLFKKRAGRPRPNARTTTTEDTPNSSAPDTADDDDDPTTATVEELIALRKLKQSKGGIDLERLNAGEAKKKRKKVKKAEGEATDGQQGYGMQPQREEKLDLEDEDMDDDEARTRKLVKSNHFTGQTNTLDVDKHMMDYIEAELQKRRDAAIASGEAPPQALSGAEAIASLDPRDELYKIAEKYRIDRKPVIEGNVTLSASMLTSIPEVDLGIDTRLKNIEDTEKAKRRLAEAQAAELLASADSSQIREHFAADRFLLPNQKWSTDAEALRIAKLESEGLTAEAEALRREVKKNMQSKFGAAAAAAGAAAAAAAASAGVKKPVTLPGVGVVQVATDERAVDNFRKRMAGKK